jgi:hypothetical protein
MLVKALLMVRVHLAVLEVAVQQLLVVALELLGKVMLVALVIAVPLIMVAVAVAEQVP